MSMGFYEYTGDDGKVYRVNYNSGKGGFMPTGDHIPTVPPLIKKALEYTARKEAERATRAAALNQQPALENLLLQQPASETLLLQQPTEDTPVEQVVSAEEESIQRPAR